MVVYGGKVEIKWLKKPSSLYVLQLTTKVHSFSMPNTAHSSTACLMDACLTPGFYLSGPNQFYMQEVPT